MDFFLLRKIKKGKILKNIFKFCVAPNLRTLFLGLIPFPLWGIWFFICYLNLTGDCDDGGVVLLGATFKTQILYYSILYIPILSVLCYINYNVKKKYLTKEFPESVLNKVKKIYLYSFIPFSIFFLLSIYAHILYVPAKSCPGNNTFLAIPYYYNWNRDTPNIQNAINKDGKCFSCNYWRKALVTTKEECDKCPNREYTGKTCILKECPQDFPVKAIDVNSRKYGNRGQYCAVCLQSFYTRSPEECHRCNKQAVYNDFWNTYECK